MNKIHLSICVVVVFLIACTQQRTAPDQTLSFNNKTHLTKGHLSYSEGKQGWYVTNGHAEIDSMVVYNNQNSLRLKNTPQDTLKFAQTYYFINAEMIEGDSIVFSGKFRYNGADSTKIFFGIQQLNTKTAPENSGTDFEKRSGDSDWEAFTVKTALSPTTIGICFFVFTLGDIELWTSDWQAQINNRPVGSLINQLPQADTDKRFDAGSKITLGKPSAQMIENLEVLGKVWGFLKYYHPEVARGKYNWDYELFSVLPQIANASDKAERSKFINNWISQYGDIIEKKPYTIDDPNLYSRIIDLSWINDQNIFDNNLIAKLNSIKDAKRSYKYNHYVIPYQSTPQGSFENEKGYPDQTWDNQKSTNQVPALQNVLPTQQNWEDQGFRILTLFRLWNAMEYCFPYVEMTDRPWHSLLKEFLPKFVMADSKANYELAITELAACIDDSHGSVNIPYSDLNKTLLKRKTGSFVVPVTLTESKSGDIVVRDTRTIEMERGDIIKSVNGETVEEFIERFKPYVPASNHSGLIRNLIPWLLRSDTGMMHITCIRNGKEIAMDIKNFGQDKQRKPQAVSDMKHPQDYNLEARGIGYIDVSSMDEQHIKNVIQKHKDGKGVILDMRKYPNNIAFSTLYSLLCPEPQEFMWFSFNEMAAPGNYKYMSNSTIGMNNPDYFKGKVAILVSEGTQSHGEFSSMAFRKAPRSAIIGSTTAGADGNVGHFFLPGEAIFCFTALGAYYPNWGICQRQGVNIDIEARPTNEEIRKGQDVWIEKAIEYIMEP